LRKAAEAKFRAEQAEREAEEARLRAEQDAAQAAAQSANDAKSCAELIQKIRGAIAVRDGATLETYLSGIGKCADLKVQGAKQAQFDAFNTIHAWKKRRKD
jgi:hypothetical protein